MNEFEHETPPEPPRVFDRLFLGVIIAAAVFVFVGVLMFFRQPVL